MKNNPSSAEEQAAINGYGTTQSTARPHIDTEPFKKWFGSSKVVDTEGKPLVVYRGEHGVTEDGSLQTRLGTYSFTVNAESASIYAKNPNDFREKAEQPRVLPVYLSIKNPIFLGKDDTFLELLWLEDKLGRDEAVRIARKFSDDIEYTVNWQEDVQGNFTGFNTVNGFLDAHPDKVSLLYFDAYKYLDDLSEVQKLIDKGFDGAAHVGNGVTRNDIEYRVFSLSQIRSAIGYGSNFDLANSSTTDQGRPFADDIMNKLKNDPEVFWHGTPSGDLRGGKYGLHLGSHEAAKQALEARIGAPLEGDWDGTREYGKTMLRPTDTGYGAGGSKTPTYPTGKATYSDRTFVSMSAKPDIKPYSVVGEMTNSRFSPHADFKANGLMSGQIKRGTAKRGYFYANISEDSGSISIVVPNAAHVKRIDLNQPAALAMSRSSTNQGGRSADDISPGAAPHPFSGFTKEQFLGNPKITSEANAKDLVPQTYKSLVSVVAIPFPAGNDLTAKYSEVSASVYNAKAQVIATYSSGDTLVVDKKYRRRGIGSELVYQWRMRNPNSKTAATRTKKSQALQERVWDRIRSERALHEARAYPNEPIAPATSLSSTDQGERFADDHTVSTVSEPGRRFRIGDLPRDMREELFNEHATNLDPEATERGFCAKSVPSGKLFIQDLKVDKIPVDQLQRYMDAGLTDLPPIVISDGRLIDGQHRVQAARAKGVSQLRYIDVTGLIDTNAGGFVSEIPMKSLSPNNKPIAPDCGRAPLTDREAALAVACAHKAKTHLQGFVACDEDSIPTPTSAAKGVRP